MTNEEFVAALDRAKNATIERCAQWIVDQYGIGYSGIANAMRQKLKYDPNLIYPGKDLTNVFPEED